MPLAAIDQTEICNLALLRLSVRRISAIDDGSKQALALSDAWDVCLRSALRDNNWNFAQKIIPLDLIANETALGWDYLYAYPPDCLFVREICDVNTIGSNQKAYEWEKMLSPVSSVPAIATNLDSAYARYTVYLTDVTKWDPTFCDCFAWKLAAECAHSLAGSLDIAARCAQAYTQASAMAQTDNAVEGHKEEEKYSPYIGCRGSDLRYIRDSQEDDR
ncbi:MAG: hypothetical protein P4N59_07440 [Negativicutes bacterium]|nr:hypothetical protein [Negativicutes bacterium]